jgi:hypothetical protein
MASKQRDTMAVYRAGRDLVRAKLLSLSFQVRDAHHNGRSLGLTAEKGGKRNLLRVTTTSTGRGVWSRKSDGTTFRELGNERDLVVIVDLASGRDHPRFFVVPTPVVQEAIDVARAAWVSGSRRDGGKRVDATAQRLTLDDNVNGPPWEGYGKRWEHYIDNWRQLEA